MTEISIQLPSTGFIEPTADELGSLARIVAAAHPTWRVPDEDTFRRAFVAQGYFYRLPQPCTTHYYGHFVDAANEFLTMRLRWGAVDGAEFLFALVAACDVPIRYAAPSLGQLQEVGLDEYSGLPVRHRWRALLDGSGNLITPTPPPARLRQEAMAHSVSIYRQERPGDAWSDVSGSTDPLWR